MNPQQSFELGPGRFDPPPIGQPPGAGGFGNPYNYTLRPTLRRPALVTAMAVASILVALISLLAYGAMAYDSADILMKPRPPASLIDAPSTPAPTFYSPFLDLAEPHAPAETDPAKVPKDGLDASQRKRIVDALLEIQPSALDEAQKQQLDHFLAVCGALVFPRTDAPMNVERVRSLVKSSMSTSSSEGQSHTTFATEDGRLTVYQDRVAFVPADEGEPLVTMLGHAPPSSSRPGGKSGYGALSGDEVKKIEQEIARIAGKPLNSAQMKALRQQLQSPRQNWLKPDYIPAPIDSVSALPDGTFMIRFVPQKMMTLDPQGQLPELKLEAEMASRRWILNEARPFAKIALFGAIISLLLAIMLFASSVEIFRGEELGLQLHQFWAWAMLPVALLSLAWAWIEAQRLPAEALGDSISHDPFTIFLVLGGGIVLLTWLYPIAVLLIMRKRTVREYYQALR